jgi:hypothetical protein
MFRTFNLGVGYVLVIPPEAENQVRSLLPEAFPIGEVVAACPGEAAFWGWNSGDPSQALPTSQPMDPHQKGERDPGSINASSLSLC